MPSIQTLHRFVTCWIPFDMNVYQIFLSQNCSSWCQNLKETISIQGGECAGLSSLGVHGDWVWQVVDNILFQLFDFHSNLIYMKWYMLFKAVISCIGLKCVTQILQKRCRACCWSWGGCRPDRDWNGEFWSSGRYWWWLRWSCKWQWGSSFMIVWIAWLSVYMVKRRAIFFRWGFCQDWACFLRVRRSSA